MTRYHITVEFPDDNTFGSFDHARQSFAQPGKFGAGKLVGITEGDLNDLSAEPPPGSWVKDRHGAAHHRSRSGRWGQPGCLYLGDWVAMWNARGPLAECGPWGAEL